MPKNLKRYTLRRSRHTADGLSITEKAFTLAEMLITLAIIGVVAAMTIPTPVAKIFNTTAGRLKDYPFRQ